MPELKTASTIRITSREMKNGNYPKKGSTNICDQSNSHFKFTPHLPVKLSNNPYDANWWEQATRIQIDSIISAINVDALAEGRVTILMLAARYGWQDHIDRILQAGADIHARDLNKLTALMWAAQSGKPKNVEALLKAGADINAFDRYGKIALHYAREFVSLRGTVPYWQLANDPEAQSKSIDEVIREILRHPLISRSSRMEEPYKYRDFGFQQFTLIFDRNFKPIITKETWLDGLREGTLKRIVAARIDQPCLLAIRVHEIATFSNLADVLDKLDTKNALNLARRFMIGRTKGGQPYYGAFDDVPKITSSKIYPFKYFKTSFPNLALRKNPWNMHVNIKFARHCLLARFSNDASEYITDKDRDLISHWSDKSPEMAQRAITGDKKSGVLHRNSSSNRLIYARIAEKLASFIYSSVNNAGVEDCSLGQLNNTDNRWRDFDLWAGRPIDVKNVTIYRKNTRQNFIPKFKRLAGSDVHISAFATTPNQLHYTAGFTQIFLGEVKASDLEISKAAVERAFPRVGPLQVRFDDQYLPAWAFEYPFKNIDYNELHAAYELFAERPSSIIAAAVAAGNPLAASSYSRMSEFQRGIIDLFSKTTAESSFSKRTIVLFAISGFISEILNGRDPRRFIRFFRQLFEMEHLDRGVGSLSVQDFPASLSGGLQDPLNSVPALFDLLDHAGAGISGSGYDFVSFYAQNPHTLLGRLRDGQKVTVYAYCGGRSRSGATCDTFPLIVGSNATCDSCRRLVCHECGFCSAGCPEVSRRVFKTGAKDPIAT